MSFVANYQESFMMNPLNAERSAAAHYQNQAMDEDEDDENGNVHVHGNNYYSSYIDHRRGVKRMRTSSLDDGDDDGDNDDDDGDNEMQKRRRFEEENVGNRNIMKPCRDGESVNHDEKMQTISDRRISHDQSHQISGSEISGRGSGVKGEGAGATGIERYEYDVSSKTEHLNSLQVQHQEYVRRQQYRYQREMFERKQLANQRARDDYALLNSMLGELHMSTRSQKKKEEDS